MITSEPVTSSISPLVSGIYGGAILNIVGNGFPTNLSALHVMIGLNPCTVIRATNIRIECIIPGQGNSSDDVANINVSSDTHIFPSLFSLNYSATLTPNVTSVSSSVVNNSIILQITGSNFIPGTTSVKVGNVSCSVSNLTTTSIICMVSTDLGAGQHPVIVYVDEIGNSNSNIFYTQSLLLSHIFPTGGSYGGGLAVTVFGQGFNTTNITATVCNRSCASITIISNTQLICVTPNVSMSEVNSSCNLTVTVENVNVNALFTYDTNLTATVASVDPTRGGTGGGTILTIQGINFA